MNVFVADLLSRRRNRSETLPSRLVRAVREGRFGDVPIQLPMSQEMLGTLERVLVQLDRRERRRDHAVRTCPYGALHRDVQPQDLLHYLVAVQRPRRVLVKDSLGLRSDRDTFDSRRGHGGSNGFGAILRSVSGRRFPRLPSSLSSPAPPVRRSSPPRLASVSSPAPPIIVSSHGPRSTNCRAPSATRPL